MCIAKGSIQLLGWQIAHGACPPDLQVMRWQAMLRPALLLPELNRAPLQKEVEVLVQDCMHRSVCRAWLRRDSQQHTGSGARARDDHVSYGAEEYRNSLQYIYNLVNHDQQELQTDSRRVELDITPH